MSTKYKHEDTIPDHVLIERLKELAKAVTRGPDQVRREFTMRIPAERDRDADLVLSEAANRIAALAASEAERVCEAKWREDYRVEHSCGFFSAVPLPYCGHCGGKTDLKGGDDE